MGQMVQFDLKEDLCILIYLFVSLQIWYVKTKHTVFYFYTFIMTNGCSAIDIEPKPRVAFFCK